MNRVLLVNDLSGLGNCSLAANISVFSAMGFEACAIPTTVLTNQSCYPTYEEMDYQVSFSAYANAWHSAGVTLKGVYSGYFRNARQMEAFEASFLAGQGISPYFNDPVMGDLGVGYDNCTPEMVTAMRRLISHSYLTTPNLTELCLLTGTDYTELGEGKNCADYLNSIAETAKALILLGARNVIVTGVKWKEDKLYNILVQSSGAQYLSSPLLHGDYSGTGDLFSSVVSGGLLNGLSLKNAIAKAVGFLQEAILYTGSRQDVENDGLAYQPLLKLLVT